MNHRIAWVLAGALGLAAPAQALEHYTLPAVDPAAVLAQDAAAGKNDRWRYAVPVPVQIRTATHGLWSTRDDGSREWALRVQAPGATSLSFHLSTLRLPAGGELELRSAQDVQRLGPAQRGATWTPVLRGDTVDLRLTLPANASHALTIATAFHGFRGFGAKDTVTKSGECNIDVVCPEGDAWGDEIRSVARYSIAGAFLCSGQMVNNTAGDFRPLFLTANHCVQTPAEGPTLTFYWNYETSTCGGTPDGSLDQTTSGGEVLAGSFLATDYGPDFTLIELGETPPAEYGVYWAGWDNRDYAPVGVSTIHHPAGDEKRISFYFGQTEITAYLEEEGQADLLGQVDTHLRIEDWDLGTTEGGSSGSGLWTLDGRHIVGQLSGGFASCTSPTADWYGRMHTNWFGFPGELTSLATHLDPTGSGVEVLDGADPAAPAAPEAEARAQAAGRSGALGGLALLTLLLLGARRRA